MTSREKVLATEAQVRAIVAGEATEFQCPFCGLTSLGQEKQFLCCHEAAEVIIAALNHIEHIQRCDVLDATLSRVADMAAHSPASSLVSLN